MPLAVLSAVFLLAGLVAGLALTLVLIGLLVLPGTLLAACTLGTMHRRLAGTLLGTELAVPAPPRIELGLWNWIKAQLSDPISWRAAAYVLLRLPLSLVNFAVVAVMVIYGGTALSYPVVRPALGDKTS